MYLFVLCYRSGNPFLFIQSGLFKFVKVGAEQVTPHLFVQYLTFLRAISSTAQSARHCYNLLRTDSAYGSGNSLVTWDHFFASLEQYLWHIHEQLEGLYKSSLQPIIARIKAFLEF